VRRQLELWPLQTRRTGDGRIWASLDETRRRRVIASLVRAMIKAVRPASFAGTEEANDEP
jgi:hypothetical protein